MDCQAPKNSRFPRTRGLRRESHHRGALAVVLLLVFAASATAAGGLGSGSGHAGIVKLGGGDVLSVAAQKDGRVIAAGYSGGQMLVVRLNSNGSRAGTLRAGPGVANAVAVQPDGKVLVAGRSSRNSKSAGNGDMVLERFNADGSADRKFGSGGTVHAPGAVANSVALGPHGTIVIGGYIHSSKDSFPRVALARFQSNGKPDRTFAHTGFAEVDLGPFSEANGVRVERDGKIVFAGDQSPGLQVVNAVIARVGSSGSLDRGFGHGGVYTYFHPKGGAASSFGAVAVDSAGRIVAGGADDQSSGPHAVFVRLRGNGSSDFLITTPSARNVSSGALIGARGIVIARHGEILATGTFLDSALNYSALWAISRSGRLDSRLGPGGLRKTAVPALLGGQSNGATVAPDGSIYSGGQLLGLGGLTAGFVIHYQPFDPRTG